MMRRRFTVLLAIATAAVLLVSGCGGSDGEDTHSPGSLDASFDPGTNINDWVNCIVVQPDGKILAGGGQYESGTGSGATPASGALARLNEDGSADGTFSGWTGVNAKIECIALQVDGKILIGGQFTAVNDAMMGHLARLNADGSIDPTFVTGTGANGEVRSIIVNADGTIMITGSFTSYAGASARYVARLTADGSLDATYHPTGVGFNNRVLNITALSDGGYFAVGDFTNYDGTARAKLAKLGADGALDEGFAPPAIVGGYYRVAPRPDGSLVVAGSFTSLGGVARSKIARLTSTGALDASFDPGAGVEGGDKEGSGAYGLTMQPDGKVLIGGYFNHYNGVLHYSTARINEDGSLDASFVTDPTFQSGVDTKLCFAIQPDGRILMGGNFWVCGNTPRKHIARVWP